MLSEEEKNIIDELKQLKKDFEIVDKIVKDRDKQETKTIDAILNLIEKQQKELNNLKEIEQSHQEENGKLRVELEQERKRNKELSDKLTEKICKGVEEDILEEYRQQIKELKEKNKELKKYEEAYKLLSYGLNNYISKDKIKEKIDFCKHQITFFKEEAGDYHNAELWEFKMKSYTEILEEN